MAEEITAYMPKCCRKAYLSKYSAVRHEKKCMKNPDNRACITCKHFESGSDFDVHDELPGSPVERWSWRMCTRNGEDNPIDLSEAGSLKINCEYYSN